MTDLGEVLARLGLSQYLGRLIDEGFEKWETVLDITEQDLTVLNFKLGHRRILQREIASARGISPLQALAQPPVLPLDDPYDPDDRPSYRSYKTDPVKGSGTGKRKYRRHPKPDEHAPEKPPSAYVMFANRVRDELKGQNLSFTDIAKLVGEKWKVLNPDDREEFEFEATIAKEKYNTELAEYKKTESYRDYLQYLSEFKQRTSKEGSEPVEAHRKRPKLDAIPGSSGSIATSVGTGTIAAIASASRSSTLPVGRVGSISSTTTTSATSSFPSPSGLSPSTPLPSGNPLTSKPPPSSPVTSPSPAVARYRDAVARTTQEQQESLLTQTTHELEPLSLPRIHPTTVHSPHIQQQLSYSRHQPQPGSMTSPYPRSTPSATQAMRRPSLRTDDSLSSSGSSSAPPLTPLDDGSRDNSRAHHRSLPFPTPTQQSPGIGYFDQRPHYPGQPSPRSHTYPLLPGPTQLVHQASYAYPTPSTQTPQPTSMPSSSTLPPSTLSSGGSLPPPTSQPPPST